MRSAWLNAKIQANKKNIVILETKRHINTHTSFYQHAKNILSGTFLRNTSLSFSLSLRLRSIALSFGHQETFSVTLLVPVTFY